MPTVKDAPMFLGGTVAAIEPLTDFTTKQPSGARVLVASGDGFASVKIKIEALPGVVPVLGARVAWMVRPMFWEMEAGSGMAVSFVRLVDHADVDYLAASIASKNAKAQTAA